MEKKAIFFKRTSSLPTNKDLGKIKSMMLDIAEKGQKGNKASKEGKMEKPKNYLTPENVARLIEEWHDRTMSAWSKEFNVSYQTIVKTIEEKSCIPKLQISSLSPHPSRPGY